MGSYQQAVKALHILLEVRLAPKQVQRTTSQIGGDCVARRQEEVARHRRRPLMKRTTAKPGAESHELAAVMMDGGRFQRRDHFRQRGEAAGCSAPTAPATASNSTHWREDKIGLVLSMKSRVHAADPAPELPEWLAGASVVAELSKLTARDEAREDVVVDASAPASGVSALEREESSGDVWPKLAPKLLSREVIASSAPAEEFGRQLEWKAWERGVHSASRQAFVADGLTVNWAIHKRHFSQMTGILDLMHALSYAWRAAAVLPDDPTAYRRYAGWIWQGKVCRVIAELREHQARRGASVADDASVARGERLQAAITYYGNHAQWMDYPRYRREGFPLTSSLMESTVKQMNARVKGTEKFWNHASGEAILQLRADSLSDSAPLKSFWNHWRSRQTGTNRYRKAAA